MLRAEITNQEVPAHVYPCAAGEPLPAKGFVLWKNRARKREKTRDSTEHRIKRTVDPSSYDCADFLLIKIGFRRKKASTLAS